MPNGKLQALGFLKPVVGSLESGIVVRTPKVETAELSCETGAMIFLAVPARVILLMFDRAETGSSEGPGAVSADFVFDRPANDGSWDAGLRGGISDLGREEAPEALKNVFLSPIMLDTAGGNWVVCFGRASPESLCLDCEVLSFPRSNLKWNALESGMGVEVISELEPNSRVPSKLVSISTV